MAGSFRFVITLFLAAARPYSCAAMAGNLRSGSQPASSTGGEQAAKNGTDPAYRKLALGGAASIFHRRRASCEEWHRSSVQETCARGRSQHLPQAESKLRRMAQIQ